MQTAQRKTRKAWCKIMEMNGDGKEKKKLMGYVERGSTLITAFSLYEKLKETSTNVIHGHLSTTLNSLVTTDSKLHHLSQINNTCLRQKGDIILDFDSLNSSNKLVTLEVPSSDEVPLKTITKSLLSFYSFLKDAW